MKKFIKNIIFTRTPLTGKYRYGDLFQIYPLNIEGAPNFEKQIINLLLLNIGLRWMKLKRLKFSVQKILIELLQQ